MKTEQVLNFSFLVTMFHINMMINMAYLKVLSPGFLWGD
jgi:hypothetical protein